MACPFTQVFRSLLPISILFIGLACQPNSDQGDESGRMDGIQSDSPKVQITKLERLDDLDLASMKLENTKNDEAGDCGTIAKRYTKTGMTLLIDSVDCYDYGATTFYYLLDDSDNIKMVHLKNLEAVYVDVLKRYKTALSERIIDFRSSTATMLVRATMVDRKIPDLKVTFDPNYDSEPWLVINANDDWLALDKKIDTKGDWYEVTKTSLKARLDTMDVLPETIPIEFVGEVLMGTRGEIRSLTSEAIKEVASMREYEMQQDYDQFSRLTKPFETSTIPENYLTKAHWESYMPKL